MEILQTSPTLQNLTSAGLNKYWRVHITTLDHKFYTQQEYWSLKQNGTESVRQTSTPRQVSAKNIGKSNETTLEDQALSEYLSAIERYKDKGYHVAGEAPKVAVLPMLAQPYSESKFTAFGLAYSQPKLDGARLLINQGIGYSRGGKQIIPEVIAHIITDILNLPDSVYLDGELILPVGYSFQDTIKAIKKYRPETTPLLQFIVFDYYDTENSTLPFNSRIANLERTFEESVSKSIVLVDTHFIKEPNKVPSLLAKALEQGYEGLILRSGSSLYAPGQRSSGLLKLKEFNDAEFIIVGVESGEGSYKDCAIFVCVTDTGVEFRVNPQGTLAEKQLMYTNRATAIGKFLTVKYQNLSELSIPRFPVGISIRDVDVQG